MGICKAKLISLGEDISGVSAFIATMSGKCLVEPNYFYEYRWSGQLFELYIYVVNGNTGMKRWVEANYIDFHF